MKITVLLADRIAGVRKVERASQKRNQTSKSLERLKMKLQL
jgi:hypothetical protein